MNASPVRALWRLLGYSAVFFGAVGLSAGLFWLCEFQSSHAGRVAAAVGVLAVGGIVAVAVPWHWLLRMPFLCCAASLALLLWLFVPTLAGTSLFSAEQWRRDAVRTLNEATFADAREVNRLDADAKRLETDFPNAVRAVRTAISGWAERVAEPSAEAGWAAWRANDLKTFHEHRERVPLLTKFAGSVEAIETEQARRAVEGLKAELERLPSADLIAFERLRRRSIALDDVVGVGRNPTKLAVQAFGERSARHIAANLDALPPGDVSAYLSGGATRRWVSDESQFGKQAAAEVRSAEVRWARRSVTDAPKWLVVIVQQAKKDPKAGQNALNEASRTLLPLLDGTPQAVTLRRAVFDTQLEVIRAEVQPARDAGRTREARKRATDRANSLDEEAVAIDRQSKLDSFRQEVADWID